MTPIEQKIIEIRDSICPETDSTSRIMRVAIVEAMQALAKELTQVPSEEVIISEAKINYESQAHQQYFIDGARFASTFKVKD